VMISRRQRIIKSDKMIKLYQDYIYIS